MSTIFDDQSGNPYNALEHPLITSIPSDFVSQVSPDTGFTGGGNQVVITGAGFTGATAVDFGTANPGAIVSETGGTTLTVTAPPGGAGTVDVRVTAPTG